MWWIEGLGAYSRNPWLWFCFLGFIVFYFFYLILIRLGTRSAHAQGAGPGCLVQILGLFIQSSGISLVILLTLPILLEVSSQLSWTAVRPMGFVAVRAGLIAMILVSLISFFPFLGPLLGSSPGLEAFVLALLTFRLLTPLYLHALLGPEVVMERFFPPWWFVLILCLAAWLLCRLLMVVVLSLGKKMAARGWLNDRGYSWWKVVVGPGLDLAGGILPFLVYARWVALAIKGH